MLKWHTVGTSNYLSMRYWLIVKLEGVVNTPYLDTASPAVPTIGIGYNLQVHLGTVLRAIVGDAHWSAVLESRLLSVVNETYAEGQNALLRSRLNAVMQNWHNTHDAAVPTTFAFASNTQIKKVLDQISGEYEDVVSTKLGDIPDSKERAALFSLAYNSPALIGPALTAAIEDGNRAEAWYEIRYNSNGGQSLGIANRRYVEANRFDLFNNENNVGRVEALDVGRMYAAHRDKILSYEDSFDPVAAGRTKGETGIKSIFNEYKPAIDTLKAAYGIAAGYVLEELQVASPDNLNLKGDGTAYDSTGSDQDFLIGSAQANVLEGGRAGDALIGLRGHDLLMGGNGPDWLAGGPGADTLRGGYGADELRGGVGPDILRGGFGPDVLRGGMGPDTMRGGPGDDAYHVDKGPDRVIELRGQGDDTLYVEAPTSVKAHNVEHLVVNKPLGSYFTVIANDLISIDLSNGRDVMRYVVTNVKASADDVTITTGRGADKIVIKTTADWSDWSNGGDPAKTFTFTDLSANDRIDIRAFHVDDVITGTERTSLSTGHVLMAPGSKVVYTDAEGHRGSIANTGRDWVVASIDDPNGDTFGPAFHGNIDTDTFLI